MEETYANMHSIKNCNKPTSTANTNRHCISVRIEATKKATLIAKGAIRGRSIAHADAEG